MHWFPVHAVQRTIYSSVVKVLQTCEWILVHAHRFGQEEELQRSSCFSGSDLICMYGARFRRGDTCIDAFLIALLLFCSEDCALCFFFVLTWIHLMV